MLITKLMVRKTLQFKSKQHDSEDLKTLTHDVK